MLVVGAVTELGQFGSTSVVLVRRGVAASLQGTCIQRW